jgi:Na+-transporting NADH:ubiquinone oxidoreductase subunit C
MNRNSNSYTVIYATVLTVLVAVVLALAALGLKPQQEENSNNEKKQQVLSAISDAINTKFGVNPSFDNAGDLWAQLDMDANMMVVDKQGKQINDASAFDIVFKQQFTKGNLRDDAQLPIFKATIDGKSYYILSLYGAGLWDAIWGYIAVEEDGNTVAGATFDHAGETAGLGAKIKDDPAFAASFVGKHLFIDGEFKSVSVLKAGKKAEGDQVDAITGATMTSNGVSAMILNSVQAYVPFLQDLVAASTAPAPIIEAENIEENSDAETEGADNSEPVNE